MPSFQTDYPDRCSLGTGCSGKWVLKKCNEKKRRRKRGKAKKKKLLKSTNNAVCKRLKGKKKQDV